MNKIIKYAQWLDYAVAFLVLGYGLASFNYLWVFGGILGIGLAALAPARRISDALRARFLKSPPRGAPIGAADLPLLDVGNVPELNLSPRVQPLLATAPNAFARRRDAQIFAIAEPDGRNLARYLHPFATRSPFGGPKQS